MVERLDIVPTSDNPPQGEWTTHKFIGSIVDTFLVPFRSAEYDLIKAAREILDTMPEDDRAGIDIPNHYGLLIRSMALSRITETTRRIKRSLQPNSGRAFIGGDTSRTSIARIKDTLAPLVPPPPGKKPSLPKRRPA